MGFLESLADVATLGEFSRTKNLVEDTVDWMQDIKEADDSGTSKGSRYTGGNVKPKSDSPCCPRYQIVGDFLLNTNTGKVWQFDSVSNSFRGVPKKPSKGKYDIMVEEAKNLKDVLNEEITQFVKQYHPGQQVAKEKELKEKLISPIDRHLALMR
ncbi:hypothetical protein [Lentiprolixibacter aurantiacus]|uniref:Uncharacterized protein n=1 Tax=Lentiprolixibacter aurantiacus TaxID=2993939 RepID=A0AAE3MJR5_9FLAO|nr:hypothetical protein [Lentiprolixibacter aurantiacus]MCX2718901.1 hypothetical protein [Lentiprolixibacter aurantiacus]